MSEFIIAEKSQLVDIADAIRTKTETTDTLSLEEMPQMIAGIETGANLEEITVEQATPSISVSSDGLITASATQTEGYVVAGTKSATQQLPTAAGSTITPSSAEQLIASAGTYITGDIKVAAVSMELAFEAFIKVTYPMGTCTCTLDGISYSHSGGGTATFVVNKKGMWTIQATYKNITKSSYVTVSTQGETQTISLDYTLTLVPNTAYVSTAWTKSNGSVTPSSTNTKLVLSTAVNNTTYSVIKLDVSAYSTLTIKGSVSNTSSSSSTIILYAGMFSGLPSSSSLNYVTGFEKWDVPAGGSYTINNTYDISNLNGEYYFGVASKQGNASSNHTTTYNFTNVTFTI